MLGLNGDIDAETDMSEENVIASVQTPFSFSSDDDNDVSIIPAEGNVFSSANLSHSIHHMSVQVRRKVFGYNWGSLNLSSYTEIQLRNIGFVSQNEFPTNCHIQKDYLIRLRKFII